MGQKRIEKHDRVLVYSFTRRVDWIGDDLCKGFLVKKSRTRKAVEFLAKQAMLLPQERVIHAEDALSVYAVAKKFKLDPAGLSRAWKRFQKQKRCDACGQVIR